VADYVAPAYYPYVDSPSTATPLQAADYNPVIATLVDLAATSGRVPTIEAKLATIASGATAYSAENARDDIGAALVAGAGITITVNDGADTITIDSTGGSGFTPSDHGYSAWTCDNQFAGSSTILATAGVLYGVKIKLATAATISKIACRVTTAGGTLTNTFLGLLDSTGTRRAVSADQSSVFNVAGYYEVSMVTPYVAAAGTYYAAVLCGSATTLPTFARNVSSNVLNDGLTAAGGFRAWSSGTGQTAVPSSVTLSGTAALNQNFWFAFK
jgi:hypothetical protein